MKIQLVDIQETFEDFLDDLVSFADKKVSDVKKVVWPEDTINAFLQRDKKYSDDAIRERSENNPDIIVNVSRDSDFTDGLENISVENAEQTSLLERISATLKNIWESDERQRRKDARKVEKTIDPTIEADSFVKPPPKETGGLLGLLGGLTDMFSGPADILDDVLDRRKGRRSGSISTPEGGRTRRRRDVPIPDADVGSRRKKSGKTVNRTKYRKKPSVSESTDIVLRDSVDADFPEQRNLPARTDIPAPDAPRARPRGKFGRIKDFMQRGAGFIGDNLGTIATAGTVLAGGVAVDSALEKYGYGGILPESAKDTEDELKADREVANQKLQAARAQYEEASKISDEKERMRQTIVAEVEVNRQRDAINKIDNELEDRKAELAKRDATISEVTDVVAEAKEIATPESSLLPDTSTALGVAALGGLAYAGANYNRNSQPDVADSSFDVPVPSADVEPDKKIGQKPTAGTKTVTPDVEAKAPKAGLGSSIKGGAKALTKGSAIGTIVSGAMLFADINEQRSQEYESEEAKDKDTAKLVGGFAGESSAVIAGGLAGAAIGSVVPVVGTAIGGLVGSAAGYLASQELGLSELGEEAAVKMYDIGKDVANEASNAVSSITGAISSAFNSAFDSVSDFFDFSTDAEKEKAEKDEDIKKKEIEAALEMRDLLEEAEINSEPGWSMFGGSEPKRPAPTLPQFGPNVPNSPKQPASKPSSSYIVQTPADQQADFDAPYEETYSIDPASSDIVEAPRDRALIYDPDEQRNSNEKVVTAISNMQTVNNAAAAAPKAKVTPVHKASAPDSKRNNAGSKPSLSNMPVSSDDASIMMINSGL